MAADLPLIVYSPVLVSQIGKSFAANAFNTLQLSAVHYELLRLCTFWDDIDLEKRSIPTIVALADTPEIMQIVSDNHFRFYEPFNAEFARRQAIKTRRRLRDGIRDAKMIATSMPLRNIRNLRDKLAHQLEKTREEKNGPVPLPRYGDEKRLLKRTITAVSRLHLTLNNAGFNWKESEKIARRDAGALWKGCEIKVLR